MRITWQEGMELPAFVKGGAMGIVDGAPVYASGMTQPWRETEQGWYWDEARGDWWPEPQAELGHTLPIVDFEAEGIAGQSVDIEIRVAPGTCMNLKSLSVTPTGR